MIEVKNLQKTYRSHGQTVGLLGADFTVPDGQIVGVLGENGAGKPRCCAVLRAFCPTRAQRCWTADRRANSTSASVTSPARAAITPR